MNSLTKKSLGLDASEFKRFVKYLFDDTFKISEEFAKHSSCNVTEGVTVDLEIATNIVELFSIPVSAADLVGTWAIDVLSDYNWGIEWDMVYEAYRVEQVTETITVTKWKPVPDAESAKEESVPAQPASQK